MENEQEWRNTNLELFLEEDVTDYHQTYSGKPGCMCGCLGSYVKDNSSAVKRMYTKMKKLLTDGEYVGFEIDPNYIFIETHTRYLALYKDAS